MPNGGAPTRAATMSLGDALEATSASSSVGVEEGSLFDREHPLLPAVASFRAGGGARSSHYDHYQQQKQQQLYYLQKQQRQQQQQHSGVSGGGTARLGLLAPGTDLKHPPLNAVQQYRPHLSLVQASDCEPRLGRVQHSPAHKSFLDQTPYASNQTSSLAQAPRPYCLFPDSADRGNHPVDFIVAAENLKSICRPHSFQEPVSLAVHKLGE